MNAAKDIEDALAQCGVTDATLTRAEKEALDRDGFVVFLGVIAADWLEELRTAFEAAIGPGPSTNAKQSGTRHGVDLASHDAAFDGIYTHPKVLAAVYHVLRRPFRAFQLSGRDPLPGYGLQGLHSDWYARAASEPSVVTSIWLLDDFASGNGATRLVPGSHLWTRPMPKSMSAPASRHPDQKIVVAPAGSVLVFNGHLWHSGTRNDTQRSRRVLQCLFVARDQSRSVHGEIAAPDRLTPVARFILGL